MFLGKRVRHVYGVEGVCVAETDEEVCVRVGDVLQIWPKAITTATAA